MPAQKWNNQVTIALRTVQTMPRQGCTWYTKPLIIRGKRTRSAGKPPDLRRRTTRLFDCHQSALNAADDGVSTAAPDGRGRCHAHTSSAWQDGSLSTMALDDGRSVHYQLAAYA